LPKSAVLPDAALPADPADPALPADPADPALPADPAVAMMTFPRKRLIKHGGHEQLDESTNTVAVADVAAIWLQLALDCYEALR
jgi:hypothetical protein